MRRFSLWCLCVAGCGSGASERPGPARAPRPVQAPLAFVANAGQWPEHVRLLARMGAADVTIERDGLGLVLAQGAAPERGSGVFVRLRFLGARDVVPAGEEIAAGVRHYLLGKDPSRWRRDVPAFVRVCWRGLWDGIDVVARECAGALEYDLVLAAGRDLRQVALRCEGVTGLRVEPDGALAMATGAGVLRQKPPRAFTVGADGGRTETACRFVLLGEDSFGFAAPDHDPRQVLLVDPMFDWSTFLGGSGAEWAVLGNSVQLAANGDVLVTGQTSSLDFPTTPGAFRQTAAGMDDVFVTRLRADGAALVWSTYVGGMAAESGCALRIDAAGDVLVAGLTASSDFPTTPGAFDGTFHSGNGRLRSDGFLLKLSATGSTLRYSTYLGSAGDDWILALAAHDTGMVSVGGYAAAGDFPTTPGAYDRTFHGGSIAQGSDAFVSQLYLNGLGNADLRYSTFLGSAGDEGAADLVADGPFQVVIAGGTYGGDFPVTSRAAQRAHGGLQDVFVLRLDPTQAGAAQLVWSTFLGGPAYDQASAIALDRNGEVVLAGSSYAATPWDEWAPLPTTPGALQHDRRGLSDAFVARLRADGTALAWSTLLGGDGRDGIVDLALDSAGNVTVCGAAVPDGFPVTRGSGAGYPGGYSDAFVTRLDASGRLVFSTFFGGFWMDVGIGLALDPHGAAVVLGSTYSAESFPTTLGAYRPQPGGNSDTFVARLSMLPDGVSRYGASTAACLGPIALGVTRMPERNDPLFALSCVGAPPASAGVVLVTVLPDRPGTSLLGITLHVNPASPALLLPIQSDARGFAEARFPLAGIPRGARAFAQCLWRNTAACGGAGTLSASNALELQVQ